MVTAARLAGMRMAKDYLELAANCESEAAKAQDRFSRKGLETIDDHRKAHGE